MCQFKSGIVLQDEREKGGFKLLMSPWTESHSELITIHKLNDGKLLHFARVEFSPADLMTADKVETYKLKIDEDRTPAWFDDEMKESVTKKMEDYIKTIIVTGDVQLLIGGQFIVAAGANVECANNMVINALSGGTVNNISGGTVNYISGGTVNDISGGTIKTVKNNWNLVIESISKAVKILDDKR
jgi:uncharacterized Zn-binding protein involved in type VI secretion